MTAGLEDWEEHLQSLGEFWATCADADEVAIAKLATKLKLGLNAVVEAELQAAPDKKHFWTLIERAVRSSHGDNYVFTQHGIQQRIARMFEPTAQRGLIAAIVATMEGVKQEFGVDYFFTSGTLLGIVRDKALIAHDDDVDVAYVSNAKDHFNWALERRAILKYLNRRANGLRARDHLPGLIHAEVKIADGRKAQFDIFSAMLEGERFVEYPLNVELLSKSDVLPVSTTEFLGSTVNVPARPERFLRANYGDGWRAPDPTFRFDWTLSGKQYGARVCAMGAEPPSRNWLVSELAAVCGPSAPTGPDANFDSYKIAALEFAIAKCGSLPRILLLGASSAALVDYCLLNTDAAKIDARIVDPLEPLDEPVGPNPVGKQLVPNEVAKRLKQDPRCATGTSAAELSRLGLDEYQIVYLDLPTKSSAAKGLAAVLGKLGRESFLVCDDFFYAHENRFHSSQYSALLAWYEDARIRSITALGRTHWAQCVLQVDLVGAESR